MAPRSHWIETKRQRAWGLGIQHRENLLHRFMTGPGLRERPFLKDVIDEIIEEVQGARLLQEVLSLDRFVHVRVDGQEGKRMWWELPDGTKTLAGLPT